MRIFSAAYVLPITSGPIAGGAVALDETKIVAVGTRDDLDVKYPDAARENFGEAAIMPGFVNCHSHLEITAMRGALDQVEHDFSAWLLKLNELRAAMTEQDIEAAATAGATEGARAGVTCFGDIGRFGQAGLNALISVGLRGVLFQETEFSPDERTADTDFERLKEKFYRLRERQTERVEVGLSPHSPYTVSGKLFEKIARFALDEEIKLSIHAAESSDEDELLRCGTGFFREVYNKYGVEWRSPLCTPIEFLSKTGVLDTGPLLAHCVQASDSDIAIIAASGASVAHCPKSNAKFGHGSAPLEKFLDASINVGLGSDSVASNNICDLLEESRFAALTARSRTGRGRFISASEILEAATLGSARALGLGGRIGSLEVGKEADIAVVSLSEISHRPVSDVHAALVFSACGRDTLLTLVGGREVYRRGPSNAQSDVR